MNKGVDLDKIIFRFPAWKLNQRLNELVEEAYLIKAGKSR